jgi:hypothetical protein
VAILIEKLRIFFSKTLTVFSVLFACAFLASCGEGNNLKDPQEIVSTSECKDLESDGVTCIPGYFVDDVVQGLNYTCGKVIAVTDVAGSFSCPQDSKVEFSILNPDDSSSTAKKIVIGELTVKSLPASSLSRDAALYFTPADFGAGYQTNIVRLLQTLRKQDGVPDDSPSRRIVIEDDVKRLLVHLNDSIRPNDFTLSSADFEALVQPLVSKLPPANTRSLITVTAANAFLKKAVHSTVAGSYWVPGATTSIGYKTSDAAGGDYFGSIRGINNSDYLLATSWSLVDRKGRITGFGIYSTGSATTVPDKCKLLVPTTSADCVSVQPSRNLMRLKPEDVSWSNWNSDGSWRLAYTLADSSGTPTLSRVFSFTQGKMDRGAIVGTSFLYKSIFGVNVVENSSLLGRWSLTSSSFNNPNDTSATVSRLRPVAPTLDPRDWKPADFPIAFRLDFYESDRTTLVGSLPLAILADGNIISNFDGRCGVGINMDTLQYPGPGGIAEYPLGTVAQTLQASNGGVARTYLALMMIVPDNTALGAVAAQNRLIGLVDDGQSGVRLRIDKNNGGSGYLRIYKDNAFISNDDGTFRADDQSKSAAWSDNLAVLRGGSGSTSASGVLESLPQTCPP